MAPRPNLTGFDIKKLAASSGQAQNDPWARLCVNAPHLCHTVNLFGMLIDRLHREQWRYTGPFTRFNRFRGTFPGFGIAAVAFTAYCGYEYLFTKNDHHGSEAGGHGAEH